MDSRSNDAELRRGSRWVWALLAALTLTAARGALAQEEGAPPAMDVDRFSPHGDHTGWFATISPQALDLWQPAAGIWGSYARSPLVLYSPAGDTEVIRDLWALHLQGAIGFKVADLAVSLPIHPQVAGDGVPAWGDPPAGAALGDLEIVPKVSFVNPAIRGFGIGIAAPITLPTGDDGLYVANGQATIAPMLVAGAYVGPVRLGGNLGYRFAPQVEVIDVQVGRGVTYRAALSVHPHQTIGIVAEVFGDHSVGDRNSPGEWLAGVRVRPIPEVAIGVAGGSALGTAVASPRWRLAFGISVSPPTRQKPESPSVVPASGREVSFSLSPGGWIDVPHPQCSHQVVAEGPVSLRVADDVSHLQVGADGYVTQRVELPGVGPLDLPPIVLEPAPVSGELVVHVSGPDGAVEGARLQVGDTRRAVFEGRVRVALAPGDHPMEVAAPGMETQSTDVRVAVGRVTFVRIELGYSEAGTGTGTGAETGTEAETETEAEAEIDLSLRVYFETGSAAVSAEGEEALRGLAGTIAAWPGQGVIEVVGWADPQGSPENNARLSRDRAVTVRTLLIDFGVPGDRLRPRVSNPYVGGGAAAEEDPEQRRVEFRLADETGSEP